MAVPTPLPVPLKARVLATLSAKALTPKALYRAFDTHPRDAVDFAVRRLVKDGDVVLRAGHYQRPEAPPPPPARKAGRPPRVVAEPGAELTHREEEVAELTATGLSAREIAERLGIKECTVHGHLTHIYVKLEIAGKPELAHRMLIRRAANMTPAERAELVEAQRKKAEELQVACERVSTLRQELQEIEGMVRAATERDR